MVQPNFCWSQWKSIDFKWIWTGLSLFHNSLKNHFANITHLFICQSLGKQYISGFQGGSHYQERCLKTFVKDKAAFFQKCCSLSNDSLILQAACMQNSHGLSGISRMNKLDWYRIIIRNSWLCKTFLIILKVAYKKKIKMLFSVPDASQNWLAMFYPALAFLICFLSCRILDIFVHFSVLSLCISDGYFVIYEFLH